LSEDIITEIARLLAAAYLRLAKGREGSLHGQ
jgi:hypothetical protein